jgi:hypothetical protein
VAADIDGDGADEIVVVSGTRVYVLGEDGSPEPGWPVDVAGFRPELLVADADRDGGLEILVLSSVPSVGVQLFGLDSDGSRCPDFSPVNYRALGSLTAITNVDGDPDLEILTDNREEIWALDTDARVGRSWPIRFVGEGRISDAIVGDVTGDGAAEMILVRTDYDDPRASVRGLIHVYELGAIPSPGDWPLVHHDAANTRRVPRVGPSGNGPARPGFAFQAPRPNPSASQVSFRWTQPAPGRTRIRIFDVTGRLVATALDSHLPAGEHTAWWDWRNDARRAVGAGVYFVRLEADPHSSVRRIVGGLR